MHLFKVFGIVVWILLSIVKVESKVAVLGRLKNAYVKLTKTTDPVIDRLQSLLPEHDKDWIDFKEGKTLDQIAAEYKLEIGELDASGPSSEAYRVVYGYFMFLKKLKKAIGKDDKEALEYVYKRHGNFQKDLDSDMNKPK
ncbi:uncharacterized protein PHALS_02700 [Plasmopara halstedii]|uniref:RxLR-like protein n=1 Tax=Plasmopara halstedii TaxID=4781 RepID=A0A0N7L775_PLAHL|nr:uncharacterized protein PHALS_02700 [Plasmopara halstedii]CEG46291.1 hypothetical protein PHALS_02700 [Plasmopara halstedii]|eukprot:XP_024582660.1 hypothetical protein PHALS_02700 [Plasmopara halstedii]